jgi:hypothetical protein
MTPRLAEILARMVEAVLDAEDAVAGGGNMPSRRDPVPVRRIPSTGAKRRTAKEAAS